MQQGGVVIQVGKNGLTAGALSHIDRALKKNGVVKVKLLRSFLGIMSPDEATHVLLERTTAKKVSRVGFVITLKKRG